MSRDRLLFVTSDEYCEMLLSVPQVFCFEICVQVRRMLKLVVREVTVMARGAETLVVANKIVVNTKTAPGQFRLRKRPPWNRYAGL
jgi:hypothetical protein